MAKGVSPAGALDGVLTVAVKDEEIQCLEEDSEMGIVLIPRMTPLATLFAGGLVEIVDAEAGGIIPGL